MMSEVAVEEATDESSYKCDPGADNKRPGSMFTPFNPDCPDCLESVGSCTVSRKTTRTKSPSLAT